MPLQDAKGPNYIKIQEVDVSNYDRESGSDFSFKVRLDQQIQYVVGVELTAYAMCVDAAPTFLEQGTGYNGTNIVDFRMVDGATDKTFSFTWPQRRYVYQNSLTPTRSYTTMLAQLLNDAIENDVDFGNGAAVFSTTADPLEKTRLTLTSTSTTATFEFLFGSGTNLSNTAAEIMGFAVGADTGLADTLTSPNATTLSPYSYVDVKVKGFEEYGRINRIMIPEACATASLINPHVTRARLLSSNPIRKLDHMEIDLVLKDNFTPTTGSFNVDFTFTVIVLANEVNTQRYALKQSFSI